MPMKGFSSKDITSKRYIKSSVVNILLVKA